MKLGLAMFALAVVGCTETHPPSVKMATTTSTNESIAKCPADSTVVGGGYEILPAARVSGKMPTVVANHPTDTGWRVECVDAEGKTSTACKAYVTCATVLH